jgi:hypothetical protein
MVYTDKELQLFRNWVAKRKMAVDYAKGKVWSYYQFGPKNVEPLVMLPGASGTGQVFYKQFVTMCPKGYHLISVRSARLSTAQIEKLVHRSTIRPTPLISTLSPRLISFSIN